MKKAYLSFCFGLSVFILFGQSQEGKPFLKFKNISGNLGVPGEFARCIIQDKFGFIWFGTDIGFKYFDGYSYKEYNLNSDDIIVTAMTEGRNGNIWAYAGADGVYELDRKKDILKRYHVGRDTFVASLNQVYPLLGYGHCLFFDKTETLWVSTHKGFYKFDSTRGKFVLPNKPDKNYLARVFKRNNGEYWELLRNGIRRFNSNNKEITLFKDLNGNTKTINGCSHIIEGRDGIIWIAGDGLVKVNPSSGVIEVYRNEPRNPNSLSFDLTPFVLEDSHRRLWVATDDGGLDLFDRSKNLFYHYQPYFRDAQSLNTKPIVLFEDKNKGLWVSHYQGGISYTGNYSKPFKNYSANIGDAKSLSFPYIQWFFERNDGNIWVSTDGGGLNFWDRTKDEFTHYKHNPFSKNSISYNKTGVVFEDSNLLLLFF